MHIYVCPYCNPCAEARLAAVKSKTKSCEHKKDKECKMEDYECKEVMKCKKCKNEFVPTKKFLKEQKRKIKDG